MPARTAPAPDFGAAIDRLRAIAAQSADHLLLGDGPPHPDAALLDLCAEIGHQRRVADAAMERWREKPAPVDWMCETKADKQEVREANAEYETTSKQYSHLLRAAAKLKAKTPAGIYAKAIACRSSKTGAALLAMSMADDLIACEPLRQSLWAAEGGAA